MEKDVQQIWDGIRAVMEKAMTNAEFRQTALSDAAAAINEATGYTVPAKARIRFVEETEALIVTLPPFQGEGAEIYEEHMAEIAGGAHVYYTNMKILTTPRGEPVPDLIRDGKDVYLPKPDFVPKIGEMIKGWLS
jgi:hypothetical protein